jgi:hypothetical protein
METVSIVIPPDVLAQVIDLQTQVKNLLAPYLVALTPDQRHDLPKMSDKTVTFVQKTLEYTNAYPQFAPAYLDVEALQVDVKAVDDLTSIEQLVENLSMQLNDSILMSGSEAYVAALTFYNSVKIAARRDVPSAKAIFDDLRVRFEQARKKAVPATVAA